MTQQPGLLSPPEPTHASHDAQLVEVKPKPRDLGRAPLSEVVAPFEQPLAGNPSSVAAVFAAASPFDDEVGRSLPSLGPGDGPAPWTEPGGQLASPPPLPAKDVKTLSDCFEFYPELSDSQSGYFFEIERVLPKHFRNLSVAGNLGKMSPMGQEQFQATIGGGTYIVRVKGPTKRGKDDPWSGQPGLSTFKEIKIHTPGDPIYVPGMPPLSQPFNPNGPPQMQGYPGQYNPGYAPNGQGFGGGGPAQVAEATGLKDISLKLLENSLRPQDQRPPADTGFAREALGYAQSSAQEQLAYLREQAARDANERAELQRELRAAQANNPADKFAERVHDANAAQQRMQQMTTDFAERTERTAQAHREELKLRSDDFERRIRLEQDQAKYREEALRSEWTRERKMLEDMQERSLREVRADRTRDLDNMRADHTRATDMMSTDHKRTIDGLRQDHERDTRMQESLHKIALDSKEQEIGRLRTDCGTLKVEVEALRREVHKPVIVQMKEARTMARMSGMIDKSEVPEEKAGPTAMEGLIKALGPALPTAMPAIIKAFGNVAGNVAERVSPAAAAAGVAARAQATAAAGGASAAPAESPMTQAQRGGGKTGRVKMPQVPAQRIREIDGVPIVMPVHTVAAMQTSGGDINEQSLAEADRVARETAAAQEQKQREQAAPQNQPAQETQQAQDPGPGPTEEQRQLALWRAELQKSFVARGPALGTPEQMQPFLRQFAIDTSKFYAEGQPPEAFVEHFRAEADAFVPLAVAWVDADNLAILLQVITGPQGGWDMAGPQKWLREAWSLLEAPAG